MTIIWPTILTALIPMSLRDLAIALPNLADALDRDHRRCSPVQIRDFVRDLGGRAPDSAWRG